MALKMKTFRIILNDMANWVVSRNPKLNNFYVGSVLRTILESVAVEIEGMYFQMHKGFKYAIENSIFQSFGFYRVGAAPSSGNLTLIFKFPLLTEILLPKGYKFSTTPTGGNPIYFELQKDTLFNKGATMGTVLVACTEPGMVGNVPAYSIRVSTTPLSYVSDVFNPLAFTNGKLEESKEECKQRFTRYIESLARGTINAITYGCMSVEGVAGVYVSEQIGLIVVYAHDSNGTLSTELKQKIIEALKSYKPAGMPVDVVAVTKKYVDLSLSLTLDDNYDPNTYKTLVHDSVVAYLNDYTVSKSLIRSELVRFIMSIDSSAIIDVNINMDSRVIVDTSELIRPGTISVDIV